MRIIYHVKVVCRSFHRCPHSTACATNFQHVWWRQRHIANALASVLEAVITHRTVTKATYKKKNNILMVFNTTDKKYIFHLCGWAVPASLCVCVWVALRRMIPAPASPFFLNRLINHHNIIILNRLIRFGRSTRHASPTQTRSPLTIRINSP